MKLKWLILLFLISILFPIQAYADDSKKILIQQAFLPNTIYTINLYSTSSTSLTILGKSENTKEKLKDYQFPIQIQGNEATTIVMTTDNTNPDGNIPFTSKFIKNETETIINGKSISSPETNNIKNITLIGLINTKNNKINVLSIKGEKVSLKLENMLKKMYDDIQQNQPNFPKTPIKVGNTFIKQYRTQLQIPESEPINMVVTGTYTLTSIKASLATFTLESDFELLSKDNKDMKISLEGGGIGTVRFDIKNKFVIDYTTPFNIHAVIDIPDAIMTIISNADLKINYQINSNISTVSSN